MEKDNIFTICRLCLLGSGSLVDIFQCEIVSGRVPADVIRELMQFEVSTRDAYPQFVCSECMGKLRDFKEFKERCIRSKELLDRAYATKRVSTTEIGTIVVERSADAFSISRPPAVLPKGGSPLVNEPNNWENSTIKQEEDTSEDGIGDLMACDDSGDETFPCALVRDADAESGALDFHENERTAKEESQDSGNSQDASGSTEKGGEVNHGKIFRCSECGKVYKCPKSYRRHVNMHKFGKTLKCFHCDKYFADKKAISQHMICHSEQFCESDPKKYQCGTCGRKLMTPSKLAIHMRTHTKERPFSCPKCAACFAVQHSLERHVKSLHALGDRARVQCDECGKSYTTVSDLKHHTKTIHMGLREFKCHHCSREFTQKHTLRSHVEKKHS